MIRNCPFVCFPLSLGNISECSNLKRCKSDQSCGVEISMVSKNTFTFLVQQIWEKQLKLKLAPSQETLFLSCGNATRPPNAQCNVYNAQCTMSQCTRPPTAQCAQCTKFTPPTMCILYCNTTHQTISNKFNKSA